MVQGKNDYAVWNKTILHVLYFQKKVIILRGKTLMGTCDVIKKGGWRSSLFLNEVT